MALPPPLSDPILNGVTLSSLPPVSPDEVSKLLSSTLRKSSSMDLIPTSLLKTCSSVFSEIIANLANLSFTEGCFPSYLKTAQISPRLKKPGLDTDRPSNYRPISNLNNISKLLESLFLSCIQHHVSTCSHFNPYQSAYRRNNSTKTPLLLIADQIFNSIEHRDSTLLVLLDLSAAFNTIDHHILLDRLHSSFGICNTVDDWLSSYLGIRKQFVSLGHSRSITNTCTTSNATGISPLAYTLLSVRLPYRPNSH